MASASMKSRPAKASGETYNNVWDALADTPEQAANLRARAELMQQIAEVVKESGWTQVEAATRCGITKPRIKTCCADACRASRSMRW